MAYREEKMLETTTPFSSLVIDDHGDSEEVA
jgi:hypothetical protein